MENEDNDIKGSKFVFFFKYFHAFQLRRPTWMCIACRGGTKSVYVTILI